ncbi:diguanylate cyclase (GGDEF) domain-containing protein [Eubacterium ruminantium]|nr:diguanylate cyclase (GGDEF) domain-containing protein [Eubacterium ruminantium]
MKQFQFDYEGKKKFISNLKRIKQWCNASVVSGVLFQIYSEVLDKDMINQVCDIIKDEMPDALYMGCTTNGNILKGDKSNMPITVICTVYEYPSTKLMLVQYALDEERAREVALSLRNIIDDNPWVKSIMTYTTMRGMSMTDYCNYLGMLPSSVVFCGGGAFCQDINENAAFVFSSDGEISDHAAVFLITGGEDYYVKALHVTGWKPLGRNLLVTKADGPVLYELDGKPAYKTYYKYLNIKNDENFFANTLEFPFLYELNGIDILRAPIASTEDGAIVMTADIAENVNAKIAYGDPWTILDSVYNAAKSFQGFAPETFTVFSCAGRRTFWGDNEISKETKPFQSLAPTSGFYTSGEFMRNGNYVNQHNVTLVIEAQREGNVEDKDIASVEMDKSQFSGKVSMINRLATFIQAATEELECANRQLEISAITDGLTKLYNRSEIQRRINEKVREFEICAVNGMVKAGASLVMMDIDNFKSVNDTYGHNEGDCVLVGLSTMLKDTLEKLHPEASVGRWGGEEFMILLPDSDVEEAKNVAELLRKKFSEMTFPSAGKRTMSLGVTELIAGENSDICCVRVDDALYEAKHNGKNRVVIA